MKKIMLLLVVLLISICATFSVSAKGRVKLNHSKKTVFLGKTAKLKVKNTKKKVKWRSKNNKIAKVSAKGKVKAVGIGKTVIVAKVGKKKYKCKITVKGYTIADREINYGIPTGAYEGYWYVGFTIKKNRTEIRTSGKCDILFMDNTGRVACKETKSFSKNNFSPMSVGDGPIKETCELKFDFNKKPKSLMGNGYIAFVVRLNNGQVFAPYKYSHFFTNRAKSGETIKEGNTTIKMPYFNQFSTYSSNVRVAAIQVKDVEYALLKKSNGLYDFKFWIDGQKTWDFLGNSGTVECGLTYQIIKNGSEPVAINYEFDTEKRYSIRQPMGNRAVGARVGTYPTDCELGEGTYELVLSDYRH